ncbi:hypothetical protein RA27_14495 [Ruegeria sp. ANG-R]|uniref:DUF805 domain-containing protein n=1 Tax=Ruegeria sp. ANG-R TaxID=1577903 RepID=UPI00057D126B|nr:DUF805 domain-containing protein [Ruegeria sp. ANG-R]KIC40050.1 hypothetical protein RA27_14495 [Ruegeria sp. ANG-R]
MSFSWAIKTCFKKYVTSSGRASRAEFWYFWIFCMLVMIALTILNTVLFGPNIIVTEQIVIASNGNPHLVKNVMEFYNSGLPGTVFLLIVIVPGLALTSRRLHDVGYSAWWIVALVVTIVVAFSTAVLGTIGWSATIHALTTTGRVVVSGGPAVELALVTIVASIVIFVVWLCTKFEPGTNQYGPNPTEVIP